MKIGFDAKRAFFNRTGLGNYSRILLQQLFQSYPENKYHLFAPAQQPSEKLYMTQQVITHSKGGGFHRSFKLGGESQALKLDVYHGLSNELPFDINKFKGKKIVTIHDVIFKRFPQYYKLIDRIVYDIKTSFACKNADIVIAVSEQTKSDLVKYYNADSKKIVVIPPAYSEEFAVEKNKTVQAQVAKKYQLPDEFILYVGTVEKRKNLEVLINGLREVALPLVVVGKHTGYLAEIRQLVEKYNLGSKVKFLSSVEYNDLPAIYQMSTVFVYPSRFEGFGIPVLEAMLSGVPVLTCNTSSLTEVGGNAARYFSPDDPQQLADLLNSIIKNEEIRHLMVEAGKQQAGKFAPETIAQKVMKLYQQ